MLSGQARECGLRTISNCGGRHGPAVLLALYKCLPTLTTQPPTPAAPPWRGQLCHLPAALPTAASRAKLSAPAAPIATNLVWPIDGRESATATPLAASSKFLLHCALHDVLYDWRGPG
jgi:hypothetical protein